MVWGKFFRYFIISEIISTLQQPSVSINLVEAFLRGRLGALDFLSTELYCKRERFTNLKDTFYRGYGLK